MKEDLLEKLADLEHEQWEHWSKKTFKRMQDRWTLGQFERNWASHWIPYSQLPEDVKEFDREWARKVLELLAAEGETIPKAKIREKIKELEKEENMWAANASEEFNYGLNNTGTEMAHESLKCKKANEVLKQLLE